MINRLLLKNKTLYSCKERIYRIFYIYIFSSRFYLSLYFLLWGRIIVWVRCKYMNILCYTTQWFTSAWSDRSPPSSDHVQKTGPSSSSSRKLQTGSESVQRKHISQWLLWQWTDGVGESCSLHLLLDKKRMFRQGGLSFLTSDGPCGGSTAVQVLTQHYKYCSKSKVLQSKLKVVSAGRRGLRDGVCRLAAGRRGLRYCLSPLSWLKLFLRSLSWS